MNTLGESKGQVLENLTELEIDEIVLHFVKIDRGEHTPQYADEYADYELV